MNSFPHLSYVFIFQISFPHLYHITTSNFREIDKFSYNHRKPKKLRSIFTIKTHTHTHTRTKNAANSQIKNKTHLRSLIIRSVYIQKWVFRKGKYISVKKQSRIFIIIIIINEPNHHQS